MIIDLRSRVGTTVVSAFVPARPACAFPAHPTRFERVTFALNGALLHPLLSWTGCLMAVLCGGETWTKVGDVTVADANH